MSGNFWDGYSHRSLYDQIHGRADIVGAMFFGAEDGAGVAGATGAQGGWGDLAAVMASARERTEVALRRAGVEWEGSAFESMTAGITPLARWAEDANTAGTASQSSVDTHVGAYESARNAMPEPVTVTSTANTDVGGIPAAFTHLFGGQTDQDRQEAAAQEAKAEAVRVMSGFDFESTIATQSLGQFVPPPAVTVIVTPAQPVGSDIPDSGQYSGQYGPGGDGTRATADGGGTRTPANTPAPGHTNPSGLTPPGTTPAGTPPLTTPPPTSSPLPAGQPSPALVSPLAPTGGGPNAVTGRGAGSASGGGAGRGASGTGGRGAGGPGTPGGPRGALPGSGPISEPLAGRGAAPAGRGGMGMAPVGTGRAQEDEDKERYAADYLRSTNDGFWDDTGPVAPSVIGADDE